MSFPKRHTGTPLTAAEYNGNLGFADLAALLASAESYSGYAAGDQIRTHLEGFIYMVAASGATDHHLTSAGGLKLYVQPIPGFGLPLDAFGAKADDATDNHQFFVAALRVSGLEPIRLSAGIYYVSDTISIKVPARIVGAGNGTGLNSATTVRFPLNSAGFRAETRGAWQDKRLYRFLTNASLFDGSNAIYFGFPINYAPPTKAHPYAEIGSHVVVDTGEYYVVADPAASDHTHTTAAPESVKLYLQPGTALVPDAVNQASGGSLERMIVQGGGTDTGDRTLYGIKIQSAFRVNDVRVQGFGGDGVHVAATVDGNYLTGDIYGNANNFALWNVVSRQNGRDGLQVSGADANAGTIIELDSALNSRFGINERCFLGNNYFSCHLDGNGTPGNMPGIPGGNGADQTSNVTFGGERYSPHPEATEQQLVETSPADTAPVFPVTEGGPAVFPVWLKIEGALASGYARPWVDAQPAGTYVLGGSYIALRPTQRNTFLGCYDEAGSAGHYVAGNNLMLGGFLSEKMSGGSVFATDGSTISVSGVVSGTAPNTVTFGQGNDPSAVLSWVRSDEPTATWRLQRSGGDWVMRVQNSAAQTPMTLTSELTSQEMGTGSPVKYQAIFPSIGIGSGANARRQTTGTAAPTTNEWARGDIVWNVSPTSGGFAGWICIAAGTPGTWKTFGAISL